MLLPGPAVLEELERHFGAAWLDSNGSQINVGCPFCHLRGMSEDTSGHLGLNFEKDAAHCVRCDWGRRGLRAWLRQRGITQAIGDIRKSFEGMTAGKKKAEIEFKHTAVELPPDSFLINSAEYEVESVFAKSLKSKGISLQESERHHLHGCDRGRVKGYVIFPFFEHSEIVYWQGRACDPDAKLRKYNPSVSEAPLGKSYWLYGFEKLQPGCHIALVEGSLDVITTQSFLSSEKGDDHVAIGLSGTAMSFPDENTHPLNTQFGKIAAIRPSSITVMFDNDAYKKGVILADILCSCGFNARAVEVLSKDPNETKPDEFRAILEKRSMPDSLRYKAQSIPLPQHDFTERSGDKRHRSSKTGDSAFLRYKF